MHINFAPYEKFELNLETLKSFKFNRLNMIIAAGVILALMITFGSCQKMRLLLVESKINKIEDINNKLKQEASEKGVNVSQTVGKMPAINSFERRINWSKVLNEVTTSVPQNIWITSFIGTEKELKVDMAGEGPDHPSIGALVNALAKVSIFSDVTLLSSDVVTDKNISKIKFLIQCKLKS